MMPSALRQGAATMQRGLARYRDHGLLVLALALLLSLSVHWPVYEVLGEIYAHYAQGNAKTTTSASEDSGATIEFSVESPERVDALMPSVSKPQAAPKTPPKLVTKAPKKKTPPKKETLKATPKPKPEPKRTRQAVEQKSRNPEVEASPDANYIAAENQRVEQETAARLRTDRDPSEQPQPALSPKALAKSKDTKPADENADALAEQRSVSETEAEAGDSADDPTTPSDQAKTPSAATSQKLAAGPRLAQQSSQVCYGSRSLGREECRR